MKILIMTSFIILLGGCSVFGKSSVENAPYKVLKSAEESKIELREYDSLILVSTDMSGDGRNGAFRKLFNYISGDNIDQSKIAMTAPVIMDADQENLGKEIPMTAPVFMDKGSETPMMSFVMPKDFTMETTPKPTNPDVKVSELKDYKVATIQFSGRLTDASTDKNKAILEKWIVENGYKVTGPYTTAAYNAPFTLPALRRNEVIIPVE